MRTLTAEDKKKMVNFKRSLRRAITKPGKKISLPCIGGPFDGTKLWVNDGHRFTAQFRVGDQCGYYTDHSNRNVPYGSWGYGRRDWKNKLIWKNSSTT